MDGMKKSYRGSKIYVHKKKGEADETLVNLYKDSEYAKENKTPKEELNNEDVDEDISAFINDEEDKVKEVDVPVKKSVKAKHKKEAAKEKQKATIKKTIGKIVLAIILVAVVVLGALYLFMPNLKEAISGKVEFTEAKADEIYYSPLTGLETTNKDIATAGTTCVMIENSTDARPQSGLTEAGVVYEAIAEGGITRFMAVYQEAKPALVGPIRSARQTFVEASRQYQCSYLHVGGATNAINTLKTAGYRNFDGGWHEGKYVFRSSNNRHRNALPSMPRRYAPHNVYTSFDYIDKFNYSSGFTNSTFTGFTRIQPDYRTPVAEIDARTIKISVSSNYYNPVYVYDEANNRYLRSHMTGGAHMNLNANGTQTQIAPTVVVAMKVNAIARSSEPKYKDYVTTGSNEVYVFQDGTYTVGKWVRNSVTDPLKFYDNNNEEIKLNRGQVWITMYPSGTGGVSFTK